MVVYLPIFALTGVEGKMFHPMAFTVVIALLGAMILSVTFIPAAVACSSASVLPRRRTADGLGQARVRAAACLGDATPGPRAGGCGRTVALSGLLMVRLGSEFIPNLNEGDFAIQALRIRAPA
jgi:cobalt-zinc-cadmium resistance protein CzcA